MLTSGSRALLNDLHLLRHVDEDEEWRGTMSRQLGQLVQRRLYDLQVTIQSQTGLALSLPRSKNVTTQIGNVDICGCDISKMMDDCRLGQI